MASRRQKSKVKKTMTAGINCKNERSGDAGNDVDHATQQETMMQSQSTEKAPGENFFHRLPIEIRQMVYGLAVVEEDAIFPVQVEARANKFHGGKTAAKVFTSLLLTCRRFYEELLSRPDFYRGNTFGFTDCSSLVTFLAALSPARRSMICKIEYKAQPWEAYRCYNLFQSAVTLLSHCSSFQSLSIIIALGPWLPISQSSPEAGLKKLLQSPTLYLCMRSDGNDWRRLRTASVLHFQISIWKDLAENTPLISGLGVSADHANIRFFGEHGFINTNATLVKEAQRLNTCILDLGIQRSPKYAIENPIIGSRLHEALLSSHLDVYGDNRVGQSHQSGMVSRGTRSRNLRAKQVSSNGVLPRVAQNPKYIEVSEDEDDIGEA